nr:immunoglobulin light chain junction region [Macaca mulatta]
DYYCSSYADSNTLF